MASRAKRKRNRRAIGKTTRGGDKPTGKQARDPVDCSFGVANVRRLAQLVIDYASSCSADEARNIGAVLSGLLISLAENDHRSVAELGHVAMILNRELTEAIAVFQTTDAPTPGFIAALLEHMTLGVNLPESWERQQLVHVFGDGWLARLRPHSVEEGWEEPAPRCPDCGDELVAHCSECGDELVI